MLTADRDDSIMLRLRINGRVEQIAPFLDRLRSMDDVDRVVDVGPRRDHHRPDSSSAGLAEAAEEVDFHDVEIRALDAQAGDKVRTLAEAAARELNIVIAFVDEF